MRQVDLAYARENFSELLAAAEAGEEVVIAREGRPLLRLVRAPAGGPRRRAPGAWRGRFAFDEAAWSAAEDAVRDDFDQALSGRG